MTKTPSLPPPTRSWTGSTRLHAWVNDAGVGAVGRFEDIPSEVFRDVVETTLFGTVHGCRAALRCFAQQGDRGVSSILPQVVDTRIWEHVANVTGHEIHRLPGAVSPERVARSVASCLVRPQRRA